MSSIVGLQGNFKGNDIIKMLNASKNRGPDSSGVFLGEISLNIDLDTFKDDNEYEIGFGHNLLDIYDSYDRISPCQPVSKDNLVLVFDGVLYNFNTIRNFLKKVGCEDDIVSDGQALINLIDFNNIPSLSGSGIVMPDAVRDKFLEYGDMGFEVGQFSHDFTDEAGNVLKDAKGNTIDKGRAYIVQPDEDCLVRVSASSKSFKPYVGFGYSGRLLKNRDDWKISFDCGAMFWGGTPDLVVHHGLKLKDGTYRDVSLINDVENIDGQVGTYVDILKAFKVYPVLSLRLTKRIF